MFNVKISLLYFLLIALCVVSIVVIVGEKKEEAVAQAEWNLQRMPHIFEVHKELRESRIRDFAHRLGTSELRARLRVLREFRKQFIEVDRFICSAETGVKCDMTNTVFSAERARIADETFGESTFKAFTEKLLAAVGGYRRTWTDADKEAFRQETRDRLKECFGRGSTQCDWSFTYHALRQVLPELRKEAERVGDEGRSPDLVLVFDGHGVGIANADNDGWSYRREYMDLVARLRSFQIKERKGVRSVYYDLRKFEDMGETEYLIAMVPITAGDDETFVGALLVGEAITRKLVESEKKVFDTEVTYIMDDKALASSVEQDSYMFLLASAKVNNRLKWHLVSSEKWLGVSIPYYTLGARAPKQGDKKADAVPTFVNGIAYGSRYQTLRVGLAVRRAQWVGAFSTLQTYVPMFGGILFLIGVILFWMLIRNHTKPFEEIDKGIHEVINGNFDYEFPFNYNEELPSVMAQSLNLMNAVLLGKPLPEDEDEAGGAWEGAAIVSSPTHTPPRDGNGGLIIETEPDGGEVPPDLMREPAETYYKRLYGSYRQTRTDAGTPDEVITYVRFVEQLVKSERELKGKLECKHVRFTVNNRDGKVVLTPIPVA